MIRDLRESTLASPHPCFVFPKYGGFSFADIPNTVLSLLGVDSGRPLLDASILKDIRARKFDHVLLFLIDGLGFDNWLDHAAREPFFKRAGERGSVTSLTAVFPSTTSASLTTMSTGLTPQEHGLPEWIIYLEEIDEIITSLPFKRWNGKSRDELLQLGIDATVLFEGRTIFERLAEEDVSSVSICHESYSHSAYSRASKFGSRTASFVSSSDLVLRIAEELEIAARPTFFYVYWDGIDTLEHKYSPCSSAIGVEIAKLSYLLGEQLPRLLSPAGRRTADRTLLLITADHGQVPTVPQKTLYITDFPEVRESLRARKNGEPIWPTGSMRNVFLHLRRGAVEDTHRFLCEKLEGKAEVLRTQEAFDRGLFGTGTPVPRFRARVGDIVVLPYPGETIWAQYPDVPRPHKLRGHHGGLSAREMFIPFAEVMLGEVIRRENAKSGSSEEKMKDRLGGQEARKPGGGMEE